MARPTDLARSAAFAGCGIVLLSGVAVIGALFAGWRGAAAAVVLTAAGAMLLARFLDPSPPAP